MCINVQFKEHFVVLLIILNKEDKEIVIKINSQSWL